MPKKNSEPKRAASAYAWFVHGEREKTSTKKKMAPGQFSKACADKWKTLSTQDRKPFEELAQKDKRRYEKEVKAYKQEKPDWEPKTKSKKTKDPNAPKKALTSFLCFSNDMRAKVKAQNPGFSVGDTAKKLGEMWKGMDDAAKKKYQDKADTDKARYTKELAKYNGKEGKGKPKGKAVGKPLPAGMNEDEEEEGSDSNEAEPQETSE